MKNLLRIVVLLWLCTTHAQTEKYKLIVFEGSDWCSYCKKLEKNVLKQAEFKEFLVQENVHLERIDYLKYTDQSAEKKAYNQSIANQFKFQGRYPTLILVNTKTEDYVRIHRKKSPEKQIEELKQKLNSL